MLAQKILQLFNIKTVTVEEYYKPLQNIRYATAEEYGEWLQYHVSTKKYITHISTKPFNRKKYIYLTNPNNIELYNKYNLYYIVPKNVHIDITEKYTNVFTFDERKPPYVTLHLNEYELTDEMLQCLHQYIKAQHKTILIHTYHHNYEELFIYYLNIFTFIVNNLPKNKPICHNIIKTIGENCKEYRENVRAKYNTHI